MEANDAVVVNHDEEFVVFNNFIFHWQKGDSMYKSTGVHDVEELWDLTFNTGNSGIPAQKMELSAHQPQTFGAELDTFMTLMTR